MFICGEKTSNLMVAYVFFSDGWLYTSTEVYNMKTGYRDGPSRRVLFLVADFLGGKYRGSAVGAVDGSEIWRLTNYMWMIY